MPELPEVEVTRLGIAPHIEGQTINKVIVRDKRLRWPVPDEVQLLEGQVVEAVTRRAKYLLLQCPVGTAILHLGMSGKLRVIDSSVERIKHDHVDIEFANGKILRFNDPRRFGAFLWQASNAQLSQLATLGPEPLTDEFNVDYLVAKAKGRQIAIKTFIMDNHVVVGVGNIYANESLFFAGIHPKTAAGKVSKARLTRLVEEIKTVLAKAIEQGGTTLKDFMKADGNPGYFAQELMVYGRGGEHCQVCAAELKEMKIGQRATVYCPECQR